MIPSSQVQIIQNLEGGIIDEILVKEGEVIEAGQVVIRLADTQYTSEVKQNRLEALYLQAKIARLEAEVEMRPYEPPRQVVEEQPDFAESEAATYQLRQSELQAAQDVLRAQQLQREQELQERKSNLINLKRGLELAENELGSAQQELEIAEKIRKIKAMPEIELIRLKREMARLERELHTLLSDYEANQSAIPRIHATIQEIERKLEGEQRSFVAEASQQLSESRAMLARVEEQQQTLKDRLARTEIRSPVYGEVKRIKVNTIGGVIQPGMEIMEVVPLNDQLLIEARIRPADIGFLRPDQKAMVKFSAYDATIYGGIHAQLEQISADTIVDEKGERYYRVRLRTEKNYLGSVEKPLPIITGMTATVELLTGQKSVLDYLLKPILKAQQSALRER